MTIVWRVEASRPTVPRAATSSTSRPRACSAPPPPRTTSRAARCLCDDGRRVGQRYTQLMFDHSEDYGYSGVATIPVTELDSAISVCFDIVIIANDTGADHQLARKRYPRTRRRDRGQHGRRTGSSARAGSRTSRSPSPQDFVGQRTDARPDPLLRSDAGPRTVYDAGVRMTAEADAAVARYLFECGRVRFGVDIDSASPPPCSICARAPAWSSSCRKRHVGATSTSTATSSRRRNALLLRPYQQSRVQRQRPRICSATSCTCSTTTARSHRRSPPSASRAARGAARVARHVLGRLPRDPAPMRSLLQLTAPISTVSPNILALP